jgi:hypothetical protein
VLLGSSGHLRVEGLPPAGVKARHHNSALLIVAHGSPVAASTAGVLSAPVLTNRPPLQPRRGRYSQPVAARPSFTPERPSSHLETVRQGTPRALETQAVLTAFGSVGPLRASISLCAHCAFDIAMFAFLHSKKLMMRPRTCPAAIGLGRGHEIGGGSKSTPSGVR